MSKLICISGLNKGNDYPLPDGKIIVGRSKTANVVVLDKQCSREQCEIFHNGDFHAVEDLHSKHGTYVDGKRIQDRRNLPYGATLRLGNTVYCLAKDSQISRDFTREAAQVAGIVVDEYQNLLETAPKARKHRTWHFPWSRHR